MNPTHQVISAFSNMKLVRFSKLLVCLSFPFIAANAMAADTRQDLVLRIAKAQGLTEMFEQQIGQMRDAARANGAELLEQATAASGAEKPTEKERAAFERFSAKAHSMFSAKELVAIWTTHYGAGLSMEDLRQILRYYESPVGKKDVAANKQAMQPFSAWMATEATTRSMNLVREFAADLETIRK
ncbi:MAG: DUF2059 domain-containing protein [Rhizobacter sp.]